MTPSRSLVAAFALACSIPTLSVAADNFPSRPVRIIASTAPGGLTDLIARTMGRYLAEELGQSVVIENRPGAGTLIGMSACARAPADGYTLCTTENQSLIFNPVLFKKLPYDARADFAPVGGVVQTPNDIIVGHPSLPANDFQQLLKYAKSNPGKVSFASFGPGSVPAIYAAWIQRVNGVEFLMVPYKGSAPSFLAVNSGEVSLSYSSIALAKPAIESGKLKAIAVTGSKRAPDLPNVSALGEFGSDPAMGTFWGLYAPSQTPRPIVDRLNQALNKVLSRPDFVEFAKKNALEPIAGSTQSFATRLAAAQDNAVKVFGDLGIEPLDVPADAPSAPSAKPQAGQ